MLPVMWNLLNSASSTWLFLLVLKMLHILMCSSLWFDVAEKVQKLLHEAVHEFVLLRSAADAVTQV